MWDLVPQTGVKLRLTYRKTHRLREQLIWFGREGWGKELGVWDGQVHGAFRLDNGLDRDSTRHSAQCYVAA